MRLKYLFDYVRLKSYKRNNIKMLSDQIVSDTQAFCILLHNIMYAKVLRQRVYLIHKLYHIRNINCDSYKYAHNYTLLLNELLLCNSCYINIRIEYFQYEAFIIGF